MALITAKDASFSYDSSPIIQNLNFSVNKGEYLCVVGENGSGKSTLIKGVLNLKHPSGGEISFGDGLQRNEIGYLPQQTSAQKDFPGSAYEVIISGRLNTGRLKLFYNRRDKETVKKYLSLLSIEDLADKCYRELSGGQQQRVLLARALCAPHKILLLDEPVAGLDPLVTREFYNLIHSLNRKTGVAVMMVSHDMQSAIKYASHILHLRHTQAFFGTKEEYLKTTFARSFLGGAAL